MSGNMMIARSQERFSNNGARKIARKKPTRHSASAVITPKRSENQMARQKSPSVSTET